MLYVHKRPPLDLPHGQMIRTETKKHIKKKFQFKGKTRLGVEAAEIHGEICAILEALEHVNCESSDIVSIDTVDGYVMQNGVFYAWDYASKQLVERAFAKIQYLASNVSDLPLDEMSFSIEFKLEKKVVAPA